MFACIKTLNCVSRIFFSLEKIHVSHIKAIKEFLKMDVYDASKVDINFRSPINKLDSSLKKFHDALVCYIVT
jgi:hypothetical protein